MGSIRIRQEGPRVVVSDALGKTLLDVPWNGALMIAKEIISCAKLAEELAEREHIVFDNAILLKAGVPIGLTNNEHLKQETVQEALYNRDLRRYMGPGIASKEQFGTPEVKHGN